MMSNIRKKTLYAFYCVFTSLLLCFLVLLIGEFLCRTFSDINFGGNSRNLFMANAYGESKGNARDIKGVSYGIKVYTDENGFRIPAQAQSNALDHKDHIRSILILGDSVGFGAGVEEEKSFAGLLRTEFPSIKVYNSSVIGYRTHDYKNVIDNFSLTENNIQEVYLVLCLNDVSPSSSKAIDRALKPSNESAEKPKKLVESMKRVRALEKFNEYLRPRSKLYLLAKNKLTKSAERLSADALGLYTEANHANFLSSMKPISAIAAKLDSMNITFIVVVSPYEFQIGSTNSQDLIPQEKLIEFFRSNGIKYIDARPFFGKSGRPSKDLFLPYDALHLSNQGHELMYEVIKGSLEGS